MNRIYKSVWSEKLKTYVAVAETAKSTGTKNSANLIKAFIQCSLLGVILLIHVNQSLYACSAVDLSGKVVVSGSGVVCDFGENSNPYSFTQTDSGIKVQSGAFIKIGKYNTNGTLDAGTGVLTVTNTGPNTASIQKGGGTVNVTGTNSKMTLGSVNLTRNTPSTGGTAFGATFGGRIEILDAAATNKFDIFWGDSSQATGVNSYGNNSYLLIKGNAEINFIGGNRNSAAFVAELGNGNILIIEGALTINTEGTMGIYADTKGTVNARDIYVRVGMDDLNDDDVVRDRNNNLANAIRADGNGTINFANGSIETAVRNALAAYGNGKINASGHVNATTHDETFSGAMADGAAAEIRVGTADIQVLANAGYGLRAMNGGKITSTDDVDIRSGEIQTLSFGYVPGGTPSQAGTHAQNVIGAFAQANGSINIGGHLTSETSSTGVVADGSKAVISINSANITSGDMTGISAKTGGSVTIRQNVNLVANAEIKPDNTLGNAKLHESMRNVWADGNQSQISILGKLTTTTAGVAALASRSAKVQIGDADIDVVEALSGTTPGTGLRAQTGGAIALGSALVKVAVANGYGLFAIDAQSSITSSADVLIEGKRTGVIGAKANAESSIELAGTLTTRTHGVGLLAEGANSLLQVGAADVKTAQMSGIKAHEGGVVRVPGDASVQANLGVTPDGQGDLLFDAAYTPDPAMRNVWADGAGSAVHIGGKLSTSTTGVGAYASDKGVMTIGVADLEVLGATGVGVHATTEGEASVESGTINVNASGATGALASESGKVVLTGGTIEVNSDNSLGAQATSDGTKHGQIQLDGGTVRVNTVDSIGVQSRGQGEVRIVSGSIELGSNSANGVALQATDNSQSMFIESGLLRLNGLNGVGVQANANSLVELQNASLQIYMDGDHGTALNAKSGQGRISGTGDLFINGTGANSRALVAEADSSVELTAGTLTSTTAGVGITADGVGAKVLLNQADVSSSGDDQHAILSSWGGAISAAGVVQVRTDGVGAAGLYAHGVDSSIALNGGAIASTQQDAAHALWVLDGGRITGTNLQLSTTGKNAAGMAVTSASNVLGNQPDVQINSLQIRTSGQGSDGVRLGSATATGYVAILQGLDIEVSGQADSAAAGCDVGAGICVTGNGSKFEAASTIAKRIMSSGNAIRMEVGSDLSVTLSNSIIQSTGSDSAVAARALAGTSFLELRESEVRSGTTQSLLDVDATSSLDFNAIKSNLYGDVTAQPNSNLNMALQSSYVLGRFTGTANLSLDAGSSWDVTANSVLQNINNLGNIRFLHEETGPTGVFKTITTNNYVGNDGWLHLSTHLGDESSPTDKLVIDGGTATGTTTLNVIKYSGLGAPTRGNGIQVVEAKNGATTDLSAFVLNGEVVPGGAYDYRLVRRADESWYLVSPIDDGPIPDENERLELPLYSGAVALQMLESANVIDTFHERRGGAESATGLAAETGPVWVRMVRTQGRHTSASATIGLPNGDNYKFNTTGVLLGFDVMRKPTSNGGSSTAGLFYGHIDSKNHVNDQVGQKAGTNYLKSNVLGAYWSHFTSSGAYIDIVGLYGIHDLHSQSQRMLSLATTGRSKAISVEVGLPVTINSNWSIEPQVQLRAMRGQLKNSDDRAGLVNFGKAKSMEARAGVRVAYNTTQGSIWARLDVLRDFQGRANTSVSAMSGKYGVAVPASLHGNTVGLTLGIDRHISSNTHLFASGDYKRKFGNESHGHAYGINFGVKFRW